MAKKPEKADKTRTPNSPHKPDLPEGDAIAKIAMSPLITNTTTAVEYTKAAFPDLSLVDCIAALKRKVERTNAGDLTAAFDL